MSIIGNYFRKVAHIIEKVFDDKGSSYSYDMDPTPDIDEMIKRIKEDQEYVIAKKEEER